METNLRYGNVYDAACPTRQVLDRLADKWTVLVLGTLEDGTLRFSEIQRRISGISQKMLTQSLRELERDGLVRRTVYAEVPPRVEYGLTDLGRTLIEPVAAIRHWAERYIGEVIRAQEAYDGRIAAVAYEG